MNFRNQLLGRLLAADYTIIMSWTLKAATKRQFFLFVQCIIKQYLDSVVVISRIIKVSSRVISISLRLRLITPTSNLILLNIIKTSSNDRSVISLSENIGVFHVSLDVGFGDVT